MREKEVVIEKLGMQFDEAASLFSDETLSSMEQGQLLGGGDDNGAHNNIGNKCSCPTDESCNTNCPSCPVTNNCSCSTTTSDGGSTTRG